MTVSVPAGVFSTCLVALALAGCGSNTQKDFLCPAQTGGSPCSTISDADRGGGGQTEPVRERFADTLGKEMSNAPLTSGSGKGTSVVPLDAMRDGGMSYAAARYRVPEEVGTLWVAPHLDADGLLHEATFVHFVVREARWASGRP